jgi:hypothetical protein
VMSSGESRYRPDNKKANPLRLAFLLQIMRQEALFCIESESILCSFRRETELLFGLSADYLNQ